MKSWIERVSAFVKGFMDEDCRQSFSDEFRVFLSGTPRSFAKTAKEHRRVRTLCYSELREK